MKRVLNNNYVKIMFLLIMALLLYFSFYDYSFKNESRIEENLKSITEENNLQTNVAVSEKLKNQIYILQAYASLISNEDDITSDESFEKLEPLLYTEMFTRIAVTNAEGISYTSDHFQHDSSMREYYIEAKKGNCYISNMMKSMVDQTEVVIMSVPVYQNNNFAGVLRATLNIKELNEYFELSFLSGKVSSYLLQSNGINLLANDNSQSNFFDVLEKSNNKSKIIKNMKDDLNHRKKGSIVFQLDGMTRYAYYSPIENTDWFMLTVLPQVVVKEEMGNNLQHTILLAIKISIIILVTGIYFFYLQYQGTRIAKKMNKQMNAIISNTPGSSYRHEISKPESIIFFKKDERLLAGYTKEEIISLIKTDIETLIFKDDYITFQASLQNLKPNTVISNTYRIKNKQNKIQWIYDQRQIIQEDSKYMYYVEVLDITELKMIQEKLTISEERYQMILKETESVIFEWNTYTDQITFSDLWTSKYGYPSQLDNFLVLTNQLFEYQDNSYIPLIEAMVAGTVESDQIECILPKSDGEKIWVKIYAKAILNKQGYLLRIVGSISDISQEKQKSLQLLERAQKDGLTNIYNRTTLESLIIQELESNSSQWCIMFVVDIDNFKLINDTLGHACGDEALTKFSFALKSCFREKDIIGRIGGDEFVVFMKNSNQFTNEQIEEKCNKLLSAISNINLTKNDTYNIHCSIGVAMYPRDGKNYHQLFECADKRLYRAKKDGKNTYIYKD